MEIVKTGVKDDIGFPVLKKVGEPEPVILPEEDPVEARARYEGARFALEAASGGKNTLLFDDLGRPSVMARVPMFLWSDVVDGAPQEPCSAFIVGGRVLDEIWISKYPNVIEYGRAYSLPGRDPAHTLSIDEARAACAAKGRGWHLLTNAEWCALAHWSVRNGTVPRGNVTFGCNSKRPWDRGVLAEQPRGRGFEDSMRTLTGTGPDNWNHDGGPWGVSDLVGNVWDWVSGIRTVDGEIQIIPDNDSAMNVDEGPDSPCWRAVLEDGSLAAPGTPGTLKYDAVSPGTDSPEDVMMRGGYRLNTEMVNFNYTGDEKDTSHRAYGFARFSDLAPADGVTVPQVLHLLGAAPIPGGYTDGSVFFLRNYAERVAARGGSWFDGEGGGVWELYLRETRAFIYPDIGFRCAWADV
ncbi:MAG: SUMF1/EgtB/PvdO family nonheme iron enzyme [Oscillospiraceae bacterium]|nr:SUMF1/EgtB/PvdO family nonheme iron enzyme [Oscillospiraceae bacterium]